MTGIIYKITCNQTGECYIGSTFNFIQRMKHHKSASNPCSSKQIIERGDYRFDIIQEVDVVTNNKLIEIETDYIKNTPNVINTRKNAFMTPKEKSQYIMQYRRNNPKYNQASKEAYKRHAEKKKIQRLIKKYIDAGAGI